MPTIDEYNEAVSEGMVQNESLTLKDSKKVFYYNWNCSFTINYCNCYLAFYILYPKPVNQPSSFNDTHRQDSSSSIDNSDVATEESTKNNFSSNIEKSETEVTDKKDYRYFKCGINAHDIYGISGTEIPEK